MPWTLQRYIFREMGKAFLLAAVALTGVLGLGGGVRLVLQLGEVTPGQLIRLIALALPLAGGLALPVAALFSAAATYGRLAADNEFVACRSSGINLHVLFIPGLVLSVVSAAVTFALINFVIPGMTRNLNNVTTGDLGAVIQQRLKEPQGFKLRNYRLTAEASSIGDGENQAVTLRRVAFVEVDHEEWIRYGTADTLQVAFDQTAGGGLRVSGWLRGLTFFDRQAGRFVELAEQVLAADDLPPLFSTQIKFLNLVELLHYWRCPQEWREVADAVGRLRSRILRDAAFERAWADWADDHELTLADADVSYAVRAGNAGRLVRDGSIELTEVSVVETRGERRRTYTAARASVEFVRGDALSESELALAAYDVTGQSGDVTVRRTKEVLGPVRAPADLIEQVAGMSREQLLADEARVAKEQPSGGRSRAEAHDALGKASRTILATLHERMAFTLSVLVLVVLAAALGIILRGAHVVAAFGISFVPALLVIVSIIMGKQMAQNAPTQWVGLGLIWLGIAAVAMLDWWTLTRVLRR